MECRVRVNGDKLVCSATILEGSANVIIGGPSPVTYIEMESEIPPWLTTSLKVAAFGSMRVPGGAVLISGSAATIAGLGGGVIGAKLTAYGTRLVPPWDFAQALIRIARRLYVDEGFAVDLCCRSFHGHHHVAPRPQ